MLMRDFRLIRKFEEDWKRDQEQISANAAEATGGGGGVAGIGSALNQYIESLEEQGSY